MGEESANHTAQLSVRSARALVSLVVIAAIAAWFLSAPRPLYPPGSVAAKQLNATQKGDAERGRHVFFAGGCAACHMTQGQDDRLKLGGGLKLPSPFGAFTVPNISPHPDDGIGAWNTADLANAMLAGVSPGGEHYYPAFPYVSYAHARLGDIADLLAFLRTLEPVAGKPPGHDLPFPFTIRRSLGLWKLLFFGGPDEIKPEAGKSDAWNRGHYIVEGIGHCNECHTPRNLLGGLDRSRRLAGAPNPEGKGRVPNITPDATGIGKWTQGDIVELLASGFTPDYDSVGSSMAQVVKNTAQLPASDRQAIAEYLRALPPIASAPRVKKAE